MEVNVFLTLIMILEILVSNIDIIVMLTVRISPRHI
jgi:hypothetical protein